jgi:hypothetical protein
VSASRGRRSVTGTRCPGTTSHRTTYAHHGPYAVKNGVTGVMHVDGYEIDILLEELDEEAAERIAKIGLLLHSVSD